VGMCCLIAVAIRPLLATLTPAGLLLFFAGAFSYLLGLVFFGWHRLPYHHAVWHLFVLAGSFLHFLAILFYIIPVAS
jgi:hemolysin III